MNKLFFWCSIFLLLFLFISCEKDVSTSPKIEEHFDNGFLMIDSDPPGAKIFLDGRNSGKFTPDSLTWLQDTLHTVKLKLELYRDTSFQLSTPIDNRTVKFVDYKLNPKMRGSIQCLSKPANAEIFLNDSATGILTPDTLTGLIPGNYNITYKLPEHMDKSQEFTVRSNEIAGYELALEDTTLWVAYTTENSPLITNDLACIKVDFHNTKWIGTQQHGLLKIEGNNWTYYNTTNSALPANEIISIAYDEFNDDIWVGTVGGLAVIDGDIWTVYTTFNSPLPNDRVTTVEFDYRLGRKWIGTQNGLVRLDGNEWIIYNTSNSDLSGDYITAIDVNVFGEIWIGTSKRGISRYYGVFKKITNYYWVWQFGDPGSTVSCFGSDTLGGNTYIGFLPERNGPGLGGLASFNGSSFSNKFPGLPTREIYDIEVDRDGYKWVATSQGIVKFKIWGDHQTYRTEYTPMKSNYITNVGIDQNGIVWFTTIGGGLTKYKGDIISK